MDLMKNIILVLCLFFLIGCFKFGIGRQDLSAFDLKKISDNENTYPVVVLGGGISGLTSSIYCAQANLKPVVIEGQGLGSLTFSHSVRNWPAEKDISGIDLMDKIKKQALENGVKILSEQVVEVDFDSWPYIIKTVNVENPEKGLNTIKALSCIIAMGTKPNFLNVPGEHGKNGYWGKGVSSCAICDGALYKDKIVGVVGGGNAAITEVGYLSNLAKKVFVFVRAEKLRTSGKFVDEVLSRSNVQVLYNTKIKEIKGDGDKVKSIKLYNSKLEKDEDFAVDGLFLAIGSKPNTDIFKDQLDLDSNDYITLKDGQETNKKGIYAAGDICSPDYKQAILAAGSGCKAALQGQEFLGKIGYASKEIEKPKEDKKIESNKKSKKEELKSDSLVEQILDKEKFKATIAKTNLPVIVDFFATWCIPCQKVAPVFEKLAEEFKGRLKFLKVNVSQSSDIAQDFQIRSVPSFIFMKNGKELQRLEGAMSFEEFKKSINDFLKSI